MPGLDHNPQIPPSKDPWSHGLKPFFLALIALAFVLFMAFGVGSVLQCICLGGLKRDDVPEPEPAPV